MQIGPYKAVQILGSRGMGTVFKALDPSGRSVAIKMIGSRSAIQATMHVDHAMQKGAALDINRRMMFVREARVAMDLNHPNIIRIFDYGQHLGLLYIVMEYLQGRPLNKVIPIHVAVPLRTKLGLIRQVCYALEYAHQHGVMHRDVKPANAFVLQDKTLKVLDFGLAANLNRPISGEHAFAGTPDYMAPEVVIRNTRYDSRVDIWAAGIMLYQLLTGRLPFAGRGVNETFNNILHAPVPGLGAQFQRVSEIEPILDKALAKDPAKRYANAGEFALELRRLEENIGGTHALPEKARKTIEAEPWWASTMAQPRSLNESFDDQTVSTISGEIRERRGRHLLRFHQYNKRFLSIVFAGALYAVFIPVVNLLNAHLVTGTGSLAWNLITYCGGFVVPAGFAIRVLLAFPTF